MADKRRKTTEAQQRASRNWDKRNKKKATIDSYRRTARVFIKDYAMEEDMAAFMELYETENENYLNEIKRGEDMSYIVKNVKFKEEDIKDIYYNHFPWPDSEALLFDDGRVEYRADSNFAEPDIEKHIIKRISLRPELWENVLSKWRMFKRNGKLVTDNEELIDRFIEQELLRR